MTPRTADIAVDVKPTTSAIMLSHLGYAPLVGSLVASIGLSVMMIAFLGPIGYAVIYTLAAPSAVTTTIIALCLRSRTRAMRETVSCVAAVVTAITLTAEMGLVFAPAAENVETEGSGLMLVLLGMAGASGALAGSRIADRIGTGTRKWGLGLLVALVATSCISPLIMPATWLSQPAAAPAPKVPVTVARRIDPMFDIVNDVARRPADAGIVARRLDRNHVILDQTRPKRHVGHVRRDARTGVVRAELIDATCGRMVIQGDATMVASTIRTVEFPTRGRCGR